jgi:hypothetical protein
MTRIFSLILPLTIFFHVLFKVDSKFVLMFFDVENYFLFKIFVMMNLLYGLEVF